MHRFVWRADGQLVPFWNWFESAICIFCKLLENNSVCKESLLTANVFADILCDVPLKWSNLTIYTVSMNVRWILLNMTIPSARMNAAKPAV